MPRKSRTQQSPQAAPGQAYGEATDQIQAQNVLPLPRVAPPQAVQSNSGPVTAPAAPVDPLAAAIAAAQGALPPEGGLGAPTARPNEPITAGLPVGPGPGPEVMGPSKALAGTVADTFAMMADLTGDKRFMALARQAQEQGI